MEASTTAVVTDVPTGVIAAAGSASGSAATVRGLPPE